ncbi:MAG: hypothetical protein LUE25_05720 [Clostridiales bacterium]|nr:hypothetical protein [Clostridiales bacterium]
MKEQLNGIALILFGILLCCAEEEINNIFLHSISYLPLSFVGFLIGSIGLFFVFKGSRESKNK